MPRTAGLIPRNVIEAALQNLEKDLENNLVVFTKRHSAHIGLISTDIRKLKATVEEVDRLSAGTADITPVLIHKVGGVSVRTRVRIPLTFGDYSTTAEVTTFHGLADGREHLALLLGERPLGDPGQPALVRLHSECLTGDVFGSKRCDCGPQLSEL